MNIPSQIKTMARETGFDLFGIAPATPFEQERERLQSWLSKGYAGEMTYLHRSLERRLDPANVLPSVKSIICLGISYYYDHPPRPVPPPQGGRDSGRIARYAWGKDYHKVISKKLKKLKEGIRQLTGANTKLKDYTDTGSLLEVRTAMRGGLGFIGKNTLLLNPQHGSYFFLAEILTNLELGPSDPVEMSCGSCRACLDACPTQAFVGPYQLDATRCISYQTIESRSEIPQELHATIGDHVFGCDVCQEVCPFNRRALHSACGDFAPAQGPGPFLDLNEVSQMDEGRFRDAFGHTSLTRAKQSGMMRNIRIVQKNQCLPAS